MGRRKEYEPVQVLFSAVLDNFLESMSPVFNLAFSQFEEFLEDDLSPEECRAEMERIISAFPQASLVYESALKTLASFAETGTAKVVDVLAGKFKSVDEMEVGAPHVLKLITSLTFTSTNEFHFEFHRYLILIVLSDLILKIACEYRETGEVLRLVACGYKLCHGMDNFPGIRGRLIGTWAQIFGHLSGRAVERVSELFEQLINEDNILLGFTLIAKVRGNEELGNLLYSALVSMKKKKRLTPEVMMPVTTIISRLECNEEVLKNYFKFVWGMNNKPGLKEGAIGMIIALFNRMPQRAKDSSKFYNNRVLKHSAVPRKGLRSARGFLEMIRGDVSRVTDADVCDERIAYIGCRGTCQKQKHKECDEFISTFMKSYFQKSSFDVGLGIFRDIIIHLAALDVLSFTKVMLPEFMKLETDDPRLLSLLMTMRFINMEGFVGRSHCKATEEQVRVINDIVKEKLLKCVPCLEKIASTQTPVMSPVSYNIEAAMREADRFVDNFLLVTGCGQLEKDAVDPNCKIVHGNPESRDVLLLQSLGWCFGPEEYKNVKIARLMIHLTANRDQLLSSTAWEIIDRVYCKGELRALMRNQCVHVFKENFSHEMRARTLQILHLVTITHGGDLSAEMFQDLEAIVMLMLCTDLPQTRCAAMILMKYMGATGDSVIHDGIVEDRLIIEESVKASILVANVPDVPAAGRIPAEPLTLNIVVSSKYNTLWFMFVAEVMNVMLDRGYMQVFCALRRQIKPILGRFEERIENGSLSSCTASCISIMLIDSYADEAQIATEEEEIMERDMNRCMGAQNLIKRGIESDIPEVRKILIHTAGFTNWRVVPYIIPVLLSVGSQDYAEAVRALSHIIQRRENTFSVIGEQFGYVNDFITRLQKHFNNLGINGVKAMKWKESERTMLYENEDMCVDYCVVVSVLFNHIEEELSLDDWPDASRHELLQYLMQWTNLPDDSRLIKVKAYARNALIPVISAGTVFGNGLVPTLSIIDMMLEVQLDGYRVLESLLFYQVDIMLNEFIRQALWRPNREAKFFKQAVMIVLGQPIDPSRIGGLAILAMVCGYDGDLDAAKQIMLKIVNIINGDTDPDSAVVEMIGKAEDMSFVPKLCSFATEHVISIALDVFERAKTMPVVKQMVHILRPWFKELRLLPGRGGGICPAAQSREEIFTVISFVERMVKIPESMTSDTLEVFVQLWYELLVSIDSRMVVLECLERLASPIVLESIFTHLLSLDPELVVNHLCSKCTFAFWYYKRTQKAEDKAAVGDWLGNVMDHIISSHMDVVGNMYTLLLNTSFIFSEYSERLCNSLMALYGADINPANLWKRDDTNKSYPVSSLIEEMLQTVSENEDGEQTIEEWAIEAARWAVGACDITIGYRGLVILNASGVCMGPVFTQLLIIAARYHLLHATDDACDEAASFVGECIKYMCPRGDESVPMDPLAVPFASAFLNCPAFQRDCMEHAMPIFATASKDPIIGHHAKTILSDAFLAYLPGIENNRESQQLLLDILELGASPDLWYVVAVFLEKPLPFLKVDRTYDEIIDKESSVEQCCRVFKLFIAMLDNCTRPVADSVFAVSTRMLMYHEAEGRVVDALSVRPLYDMALAYFSQCPAAHGFLYTISRVDAAVADLEMQMRIGQRSLHDVGKAVSDMIERQTNLEFIPMTNCKELCQMCGVIDTRNRVKIVPYATYYDSFVSLQAAHEERSGRLQSAERRRFAASHASSARQSTRSFTTDSGRLMRAFNFAALQLSPLEPKDVEPTTVEIPIQDRDPSRFLVTLDEFLELDVDEDDSSTSVLHRSMSVS